MRKKSKPKSKYYLLVQDVAACCQCHRDQLDIEEVYLNEKKAMKGFADREPSIDMEWGNQQENIYLVKVVDEK